MGPIQEIQVSRALIYQESEIPLAELQRRLRDGLQKYSSDLLSNPNQELGEQDIVKLMKALLSGAFAPEQESDVRQWFAELAAPGRVEQHQKKIKASVNGPLAEIYDRCLRKRQHLSMPVMTFLPLRTN